MKLLQTSMLAALFAGFAAASTNEVVFEDLVETFEQPKNIMFSTNFGGASHVNWVLSILDELSHRGHNVTFVTSNLHKKFAKPYPHFNTIILEGNDVSIGSSVAGKHTDLLEGIDNLLKEVNKDFDTNYVAYQQIMKELNVDVALCDFGTANGCYEAAIATNTPYIVTEAFAMASDASAPYINNDALTMQDPTTLRMNFIDRFNDMFVKPARAMMKMLPVVKDLDAKRREVGCNISSMEGAPGVHNNNLKIVNSLYGIEPARPMGPLVEMVGPILPRKYNPLTPELKTFLDAHERVVYIAFGQHATSNEEDNALLLTAIMENIEMGVYDGFLWAARGGRTGFPKSIKTKSGQVYDVELMFDGAYQDYKFIQWAPQTAVVMHPSVSVFLTHGGAGSFYEGLYAGKRLAVFPFFADQFPNAYNVERNGMGVRLSDRLDKQQVVEKLEAVGRDVSGEFQKNVDRYRALIQIHSRHGRIRAADLVEEVIFVNKDGLLPYRYEDSRQMSFIKAHNFDLFAVALLILLLPIIVLKKLCMPKRANQKQKVN